MNRSRPARLLILTAVVLGSVGVMIGLRAALGPVLGTSAPLILMLLPVLASSWAGGFWPGLAATLVGGVLGIWLFAPGKGDGQSDLAYWLGRGVPYTIVGAMISLFADRMNAARRHAKLQTQALRQSQELQRQAFDSAVDFAIFTTDAAGTITTWNVGAEALFGYPESAAVGMAAATIYTAEDRASGVPERERVDAAAHGVAGDDRWHLRRDGSRFFASGTVRPLRDEDGRVGGFVKIARDVTPQHDARQSLLESRRRTDASLLAGDVGTYYWDLRADRVYGDRNFVPIFGVPLDENRSAPLADFVNAIHPDDRDRVRAAIDRTLQSDAPFATEYRVNSAAGERWVMAHGTVERGEQGEAVGWAGVVIDVTERKLAERRLADSEALFRSLFDSMDEGCCLIEVLYDDDGRANDYRFLRVNSVFEKQTGLADAVGRRIKELAARHEAHWFETYGRVVETGEPVRFTNAAAAINGGVVYDVYACRIGPAERRQVAVLFNDITVRRRSELALAASEERLRLITDNIPALVAYLDTDTRYVFVNAAYENWFGFTRDKLLGRTIAEVFGQAAYDARAAHVAAVLRGEAVSFESHFDAPDGRRLNTVSTFVPDVSEDAVRGFYVFALDVTARRRAEAQLNEARRRVDAALIAGDIGVYDWDIGADRVAGDASFARMYGVTPDADGTVSIELAVERIHPHDRDRVVAQLTRARENVARFESEYRVGDEFDGRWVVSRGRFEAGPDGRAGRMLGTIIDITERKKAQAEIDRTVRQRDALIDLQRAVVRAFVGPDSEAAVLEEAAARVLAVLPDAEGSAVEMLDAGGEYLVYQAVAGLLSGHAGVRVKRSGSLTGLCLDGGTPLVCDDSDTDPRVDRDTARRVGIRSMLVVPLQRGGRFVGVLKFASGRPNTFAETDVLAAQLAVGAIATGLTAASESRAVEALLRSEAQFRTIADAMPQFVWVTRPDGFHEYYNKRWYEYIGVTPGQSDGDQWAGPLHPDDIERSRERWQASLASGEPYEIEYRFRRHDGVYRWFLGRALAVRDDLGRIVKWYGTCTDIDEQKRLQQRYDAVLESERNARAQAEEAGRMKDEFLATISHELRTPLTAIVGWAHLLSPTSDFETLTEGLDVIHRNAQTQSQLIEDILDMSRITSGRMRLHTKRVNLREPIEAAVATVRTAANAKGVRLVLDLDGDAELTADPDRLQQVFWNLLANAIKFTDRGGQVTVRRRVTAGEVVVDVIDTGKGIAADFLPFVFDRFRQADMTTTRRHGGLGLGLAIVRSLVELHGGRVSVESAGEGFGSTFRVELPTGDGGPPADGAAATPVNGVAAAGPHARLAGRRVLILDDEPDARRVMQAVLARGRVQSVLAATVAEAVALLGGGTHFDAVISDIGMPNEDGYVFIRRLRAAEAGPAAARLPAIALTAYTRPSDRASVLAAGFDQYLAKPVDPAALLQTLDALIGPAT